MKRYLIGLCFLTACGSPQTLSGPGVQAALQMPQVQFNATTILARNVAAGCGRYAVSDRQIAALVNARSDAGTGNRVAIDAEVDVTTRSFQAKHDLTVGADNTCIALDAEVAQGTALSTMLVSG